MPMVLSDWAEWLTRVFALPAFALANVNDRCDLQPLFPFWGFNGESPYKEPVRIHWFSLVGLLSDFVRFCPRGVTPPGQSSYD